MEMDTRSSLTIVSWATIRKAVLGIVKKDLNPQRIHLRDNQGNRIPVIVIGTFQVNFKKFSAPLKITVVGGALPSRLSLDWFEALGMEVTEINAIHNDSVDELIREFEDVFNGSLGKYKGTPITFSLD